MKNVKSGRGIGRIIKMLFSFYPVLVPITLICIIFSALVSSIPSIFIQRVIEIIEKWSVTRDWVSAQAELIPTLLILITLYVLSILSIFVHTQLNATLL